MNEVKVLIFDLDNTLINYGGVTKQAWQMTCKKVVEEFKLSCDYETMANQILVVNDEIWTNEDKRPKGNFSFYDLRTYIVKKALYNLDITNQEVITYLVNYYDDYKKQAVYMFEDVPNTLKTLKERGYSITLLTNGDGVTQREKLKRFNMERYFDGIFIDGEQGVGKPEYEAYNNILQAYNVKEQEACMIGDHYLWEVVAPINYGLKAIWVNRGELGLKGNEEVKPNYTIHNIGELLEIFQ